MTYGMSSGWTDERVELLKTLHAQGFSFSSIARQIGGVSRSSCIGKARRLGLEARMPTAFDGTRVRTTFTPKPAPRVAAPPPPPVVEEPPLTLPDGSHVTTMTLTSRTCRWPVGDPALADFHFCGHKPKDGSPYCEAHSIRAFQPKPVKTRAKETA